MNHSLFPPDTELFPEMHPPSVPTDCPQESELSSWRDKRKWSLTLDLAARLKGKMTQGDT